MSVILHAFSIIIIIISIGISIEFEKQAYTVREGEDHNVEVCLNIPSEFDFTLFGTVSVQGEDAQGTQS